MLHYTRQLKNSHIVKVKINVYVYDKVMIVKDFDPLHKSMEAFSHRVVKACDLLQ